MTRPQRGGASMRRLALLLALPLMVVTAALPPLADAQQPRRGGVFRIAEREAPSLDPHLSISFLTHSYVSLVYSQLVRFPNGPEQKSPTDFSIVPDLAEKWTTSKDGKIYTFHLRRGVRFHNKPPVNAREVTAEDVKYSLERFMAKSGFNTRFEPVTGIDVVDRYTVRVTLKEPYAPFLNHLANPSFCVILPREAEEKFKDFNHPDAVIGTGPFVLRSYDKGVRVVFERNPDYFMKGFPYLDGVVIEITPDAAARVAVLRAGKADLPHIWGWVSPEEGKALQKTNPELVVVPHQVIGQGFIYMRTDQPPFNDIRVRRAVSLAIDRNAWNDALLFGEGCIDPGPIPCALKEWKLAASKIDAAKARYLIGYDPAEAKKLLVEAGHGKGLTVPMFHWPGYVVPWRSYYELAADNLGKVGITVELKPEEYGKYISTTALGKYEKMAMGPSTPFTEVDDFLYGRFYPELPTNQSRVADAELSKMLTAQRREMDPKKRKQVVDDIQRYLADKAYYVYVPQWPQYVAHPAYVKGFRHHDGYGLGMRLIHTWLDK
ncbi:MAG: ABC transporter substrate-binding protein [Chloroflexi bacterium]|nr:MAG: ABC transporter substrate-binding protein [Chloroflexota bacterium]